MTLPITAYGNFLINDLKLTQSSISRYYAITFLPWCLKPLYTIFVNRVAFFGKHRVYYLVIGSLVNAFCFFITTIFVRDVTSAFIVAILKSFAASFVECVLDLIMLDMIDRGTTFGSSKFEECSEFQSRVHSSQTGAYLFGFIVYGCNKSDALINSRSIIFIAGFFPFFMALVAFYLPEPKAFSMETSVVENAIISTSQENLRNDQQQQQEEDENNLEEITKSYYETKKNRILIIGVMYVQFLLFWLGLQDLIELKAWIAVLLIVFLLVGGVLVFKFKIHSYFSKHMIVALTLFFWNALPSYSIPWFSFTFFVLKQSQCAVHLMMVAGEFVTLAAYMLFPYTVFYVLNCFGWGDYKKSELTFLVYNCFATIFSLFCLLLTGNVSAVDDRFYVFCFALVSLSNGFFGALAFLAEQTYATEKSFVSNKDLNEDQRRLSSSSSKYYSKSNTLNTGLWFSIFISFLDFGDSVASWISAPLISAFRLESYVWNQFWMLILTCIVISFVALGMIACAILKSEN